MEYLVLVQYTMPIIPEKRSTRKGRLIVAGKLENPGGELLYVCMSFYTE